MSMRSRRKKMSNNNINSDNDVTSIIKEVAIKAISITTKSIIKVIKEEVIRNNTFDIQTVMRFHGMFAIFIGTFIILLPHGFYNIKSGYNHLTHEYLRLYGCLTFAIGWLVWKTQDIRDGRLLRAIGETFAICYGLQSLVMIRAQLTNPTGHSFFHWLIIMAYSVISASYGYVRITKKIKTYELPGQNYPYDE